MRLVLFTTVRFERQDDVEEHKEREYERLDEADEQLEPHERKHEARQEEERREHGEHDLAAPHVAPESERQREDAEELAEELDDADKDHDDAHEHSLVERREVEPPREVRNAVLPDAGRLIPDEASEGQSEVGVIVRRRNVQQPDLPNERNEEQPVAEEGEQEQGPKERQVPDDTWAARILHEVHQELHHQLDQALETTGHFANRARGHEAQDDEDPHNDPHGEDGVRDGDVVPDRDDAAFRWMLFAAEVEERRTGLLSDMDVGLARRPVRQVPRQRRADDGEAVQEQHDANDLPHSLSSPDSFFCSRSWISRSQRLPASRAASVVGGVGLRAM